MECFRRLTTYALKVQSPTCHIARRIVGRLALFGMVDDNSSETGPNRPSSLKSEQLDDKPRGCDFAA